MKKEQKLERFAEREFKRNMHTLIIEDEEGGYIAFGRYRLIPRGHQFDVFTSSEDLIGSFSNKRIAMSWCVADKYNQLNLAHNIKNLDVKKQSMEADLYVTRSQADRTRNEGFAEVVLTKLQPKVERLSWLNNELEKCLNSAKYLQLRGFQNETARTSDN
jgi:hypothetical protein